MVEWDSYPFYEATRIQRIKRRRDEMAPANLWSCVGKRRFPTYKTAKRLLRRWSLSTGRLHAYHCGTCKRWHLGNG